LDESSKFAIDRMLARTARWMRLLGADTLFDSSLDGAAMLKRARDEGRVFVTRDKRFLTTPNTIFLESNDFRAQLHEIFRRYAFDPDSILTRCSRCNAELRPVDRDSIAMRVPPFVYASIERFARCPVCGRIYWEATHHSRILAELRALGFSREPPTVCRS
jgi:uncharacterized protein